MIFMNLETGELLFSLQEVKMQAREYYDWGDETNIVSLSEYYKRVD